MAALAARHLIVTVGFVSGRNRQLLGGAEAGPLNPALTDHRGRVPAMPMDTSEEPLP